MKKGIFHQIQRTNPIDFSSKNSEDIIRKSLEELYIKSKDPVERRITIWTGQEGYYTFNWILMFGDTIKSKIYHHTFKRLKGFIYISLFKKHGPLKVKIKSGTFSFYRGTQLFHEIKDVNNQWESDSDALINPKKTFRGIDRVNAFIDKLKKEENAK